MISKVLRLGGKKTNNKKTKKNPPSKLKSIKMKQEKLQSNAKVGGNLKIISL